VNIALFVGATYELCLSEGSGETLLCKIFSCVIFLFSKTIHLFKMVSGIQNIGSKNKAVLGVGWIT
jgi:hypothetical protein